MEASLGLNPAERERIKIGLWALGFNPGAPDGKFGSATREAIRKWQTSRGHEATGHLDAESKNALLAAVPDLSGPIWLTAQNQPCKVWNPYPKAGETLTWTGGCVDGKASGRGRQVWRGVYGESVYEGEFRYGKRHGRGIYTWVNGQTYDGEWRNGKQHGHGTCTDAEVSNDDTTYAHRYEGEWRDGNRHGRGVATAHKMLRILYVVLRDARPYHDPEADYEALMVRRNATRWIRRHGLLEPGCLSTTAAATT